MKNIFFLLGFAIFLGCTGTSPSGREVISTKDAPAAIGPYSQAIRVGNALYLAGQIPIDPTTGQLVSGGITEQTRQVMENLKAILTAAGFSMSDVVQCRVYLSDLSDYVGMNEVYAGYFKESPPARAVVQVSGIPRDALLEVMATAIKID